MTELEDLYLSIPDGIDNAVTRSDLADALGMSDREVRRAVHRLRAARRVAIEDGHRETWPLAILSRSRDGVRGYWKSADPDEIARYNAEILSRVKKLSEVMQ